MSRNKYPEETINRILVAAEKLFLEKGYENTTIQDIVNELGNLSKGAIYHHFKSKEEIVDAVGSRIHGDVDFRTMFDGKEGMTGREKIKQIALFCVRSTRQQRLMKSSGTIMDNPKFLALAVRECVESQAEIMLPYIEEGNRDGSLKVEYPEEAAEAMMLLANIWTNPMVFKSDSEKYTRRLIGMKQALDGMGLTVIDDEVIESILLMKKNVE